MELIGMSIGIQAGGQPLWIAGWREGNCSLRNGSVSRRTSWSNRQVPEEPVSPNAVSKEGICNFVFLALNSTTCATCRHHLVTAPVHLA